MSGQAQLHRLSHTKNLFHASIHSLGIGLSGILQSDQSIVSWIKNQALDICWIWNLGWEVKCHNNSPFRLI